VESLHKAGVLLALDGLHTGTGPPFRRHGSDDEYREVVVSKAREHTVLVQAPCPFGLPIQL